MPARGQEQQRSFADRHLQERRVSFIKPGEDFDAGEAIGFHFSMLPEMNLRKIVEARVIEGGKQWTLKIDLLEHRVAGAGFFLRADGAAPDQFRENLCALDGFHWKHRGLSLF